VEVVWAWKVVERRGGERLLWMIEKSLWNGMGWMYGR
jgi:hypothetical protein